MKIILLIDANFSNREYERWGIYKMLNEKIEVQIFDFRRLRKGGELTKEDFFEKDGFDKRVKRFNILNSLNLEEIAHELKGAFVIDNRSGVYDKYTTCWFKSVGAYIVELDQGLLPTSIWRPSIFDLIIMSKNTFTYYGLISLLFRVIGYVINRLKNNILNKSNPGCSHIKVCSGAISKCSSGEFEIRSHAFDYDIYLQQKNQNSVIKYTNYAVFLESGIVDHPDAERLKHDRYSRTHKPTETDDTYYPAIRSFFDDFEKRMGMPVIIALGPRIILTKDIVRKFGGREVISNDTSRLVRHSKMAIAHQSTSINFAVLWRIPLLIITTTLIDKTAYNTFRSFEDIFKTKRININKSYKNQDYTKISRGVVAQYDFYKENLIKTNNSPKVNSATILINGLKEYV
jgi:hypothetical protein